jgi:hypothetical protein
MKLTLKNITRTLTLGALASSAAFAQITATGATANFTITGSISDAISMTDASNGASNLTQTFAFGNLAPTSLNQALTTLPLSDVRIRSNQNFKLNATVTASGFATDGLGIATTDIGFGITAVVPATNAVARTSDTITPRYNYATLHPFTGYDVTNGKTPFTSSDGTLNDIASSAQLISGNRISKGGNIKSTDNYLQLSFAVATLAQYFTANSGFSAQIILTPTTP